MQFSAAQKVMSEIPPLSQNMNEFCNQIRARSCLRHRLGSRRREIAAVFSEHMVLQADATVAVWLG